MRRSRHRLSLRARLARSDHVSPISAKFGRSLARLAQICGIQPVQFRPTSVNRSRPWLRDVRKLLQKCFRKLFWGNLETSGQFGSTSGANLGQVRSSVGAISRHFAALEGNLAAISKRCRSKFGSASELLSMYEAISEQCWGHSGACSASSRSMFRATSELCRGDFGSCARMLGGFGAMLDECGSNVGSKLEQCAPIFLYAFRSNPRTASS